MHYGGSVFNCLLIIDTINFNFLLEYTVTFISKGMIVKTLSPIVTGWWDVFSSVVS
jgi:hypothetical protein